MRFEDAETQTEQIAVLHQLWKVQHTAIKEHEQAFINLVNMMSEQEQQIGRLEDVIVQCETNVSSVIDVVRQGVETVKENHELTKEYAASLDSVRGYLQGLLSQETP